MTSFKSMLVLGLLLPLAASMKLDGKPLSAIEDGKPKIGFSVVSTKADAVAEMQQVFARSDAAHQKSMDEISKDLTMPKAMESLENGGFAKDSLKQVASLVTGSQNLRKGKSDGFGGLDGARRLLNDMIHEAASKYDAEIAKCTSYYAEQCALMEVARGQISAANFIAATSRGLILDAQAIINQNEVRIPVTKKELKDHNHQCENSLYALDKQLKIVMGDIAIMTMILKMSDCDAKLMQINKVAILHCEDSCTKKQFVEFDHADLQKEVGQLKLQSTKDMITSTFADLFNKDDDGEAELIQQDADPELEPMDDMPKDAPKNKKTKFNNKPMPVTKVPANPCTDPMGGAPGAAVKRAAKCTLKKSPQCYKLQQRFLIIQAGIEDIRDELMEQIAALESDCKAMKESLEASIEVDKATLSSSQTKLAAGTEKEATAGETGRQVAKENAAYNADLIKQMKICTGNYINFETELCALKKIRGDVFKKMKEGHKGFFQDCQVSPWTPEACSKVCAGGEQKLIRSVMLHPDGEGKMVGSKCLPLTAEKSCNLGPCPVNCKLATWSGWSKCSAKCGGGVSTRVRDVKVPMRYDGRPCGGTTESKACAVASCEEDCVLHKWTAWSACSKDCDGGTKKRMRNIRTPVVGGGECESEWSEARLQYLPCNQKRCKAPRGQVMKCNQTYDIVLVMDGTPKSGKKGWAASVKAANKLLDAWDGPGLTAKPNVAVVHYTGPRTWTGVSKCTGKSKNKVDMVNTCKIKLASHFSEDMKKTKNIINALEYSPGSKLLSLALMTVQSELPLGRRTARTAVIVFIDGAPLSFRKTRIASHTIRKSVRLLYVPVIRFSPLKDLKQWASRRWQENIVAVKTSSRLGWSSTGTHIIANICPKKFPVLKNKRR